MRRRLAVPLSLATWIGCAAVVGSIVGCQTGEKSGACNGSEDGTYFRLQVYNYIEQGGLDVKLNGRFVGSVDAATKDLDNSIIPAQVELGDFPVCDAHVLSASGPSSFSRKFCSNNHYTGQECHDAKTDYCWESFGFYTGSQPTDVPQGLQSPQCSLYPGPQTGTSNGNPTYAYPCLDSWVQC